MPPSLEQALHDLEHALDDRMAALLAAVPALDPTLDGAVKSSQGRIAHEVRGLHAKVISAAKRRHETLRRQFAHAQHLAFPGGHPQERVRVPGLVHEPVRSGPRAPTVRVPAHRGRQALAAPDLTPGHGGAPSRRDAPPAASSPPPLAEGGRGPAARPAPGAGRSPSSCCIAASPSKWTPGWPACTTASRPKVYARPFVLRIGQALTRAGTRRTPRRPRLHTQGPRGRRRASSTCAPTEVRLVPRGGTGRGQVVRVGLTLDASGRSGAGRVAGRCSAAARSPRCELEAPLLTAVAPGGRGRQRQLPLAQLPPAVVQAVLAIEDRRFYSHPGVDVIRTVGAVVTNMRGDKKYLVGGSTLTQQLVKNSFLTPEKTYTRKVREQMMSIVLERRLVEGPDPRAVPQRRLPRAARVVLGARRGRGRAPVLRQGRQQRHARRSGDAGRHHPVAGRLLADPRIRRGPRERRDVVLRAMVEAGYVDRPRPPTAALREPLADRARAASTPRRRTSSTTSRSWSASRWRCARRPRAVAVHTTLDLHLQRAGAGRRREGRRRDRGAVCQAGQRARSAAGGAGRRRSRAPATSSRWSAGGPTSGRSTTAPRLRSGSPDRRSSRSSSWPRSTWPCARAAPTSRPATVARPTKPATFLVNGAGVDAAQLRRRVRRRDHGATGAGPLAQPGHHPDGRTHRLPAHRRAVAAASSPASRRAPTRRSRSASSRPRRSTWPRPTPSFPTSAKSGRCARSRASRSTSGVAPLPEMGRARRVAQPGADLPRHQHDAQRAQRGHRRGGARLPASRSTRPARAARPTTCATPGSSASRPSC